MPRGPWWTKAEARRTAESLRTGDKPTDVVASTKRTWNAIKLTLTKEGYSVQELMAEGRRARVRKILLEGGYTAEVMASENVTKRHAQHLISEVAGHEDRRTLLRTTERAEERRIYLSVREVGFSETARRMKRPLMSVWKIANRYRAEVLPESPPLKGVRGRRTDLRDGSATPPAGG